MTKPLKGTKNGEVIPPPRKEPVKLRANLVTLGDVRSEMGRVYNTMQRGEFTYEEMTKRIWALRQIGSVIESAENLGIGAQSDDDERPVFSGLTITPPPLAKQIASDKPQRIKQ